MNDLALGMCAFDVYTGGVVEAHGFFIIKSYCLNKKFLHFISNNAIIKLNCCRKEHNYNIVSIQIEYIRKIPSEV
jgi:hypothetical protein